MIAEKISRIGEPSSPAIAAGYRPRPENYRPQRESRSHLYPAPGSRCRAARSSRQERGPPKPPCCPPRERHGRLSAAHAERDNLRMLTAMIDTPVQRAESAIWLYVAR